MQKTLPEGWTLEDIRYLLEKLDNGRPILVASSDLGIPTIHGFSGVQHAGYGVMVVKTAAYKLTFDAGSAMQRTPSGSGWTTLDIEGEYDGYDIEEARRTLEAYLPQTPEHILTYGDNGYQVFFEGERYMLLNPYLGSYGTQVYGWILLERREDSWGYAVKDDGELNIAGLPLEDAREAAEAFLGVKLTLTGAPETLPGEAAQFRVAQESAAIEETRKLALPQYILSMDVIKDLPFTTADESKILVYKVGRDALLDDGEIVTIAGFAHHSGHPNSPRYILTWRWDKRPHRLHPKDGGFQDVDTPWRYIWEGIIKGVVLDEAQLDALNEQVSCCNLKALAAPLPEAAVSGGNWWRREARPTWPEYTLTYGDNGAQVYFEDDRYLLLNPYRADTRTGVRYGGGWRWLEKTQGDYTGLLTPDGDMIGGASLKSVLRLAEEALGARFKLTGAPDDLPDELPPLSKLPPQTPQKPQQTKSKPAEKPDIAPEWEKLWEIPLADWLELDHKIQRSGGDMHYAPPGNARRILWPGYTSKWKVIVAQHKYLIKAASSMRHSIPPEVAVEYPDLAKEYSLEVSDTAVPLWARPKKSLKRKVRRAHTYIVHRAVEAGYPVPAAVLADYPDLQMFAAPDSASLQPETPKPAAPKPARPKHALTLVIKGEGMMPTAYQNDNYRLVKLDENSPWRWYPKGGYYKDAIEYEGKVIETLDLQEALRLGGEALNARFYLVEPEPEPESPGLFSPEGRAEFEQWELHLLTGAVKKRNSAFNRALRSITRPDALELALEKIAQTDARRRAAIQKRLDAIAKTRVN